MHDPYILQAVLVIAVVTAALRFIPFLVFKNDKKTPRIVEKLGRILPYAVMGMLVVYCLKEVKVTEFDSIMPTILGCLITGGTYIWKRNTLLSIACGTIGYMLLVQLVF